MEMGITLTLEQQAEGIHAAAHAQTLHPVHPGDPASLSDSMRLQKSLEYFEQWDRKLLLVRLWRRKSILRQLLRYECKVGRGLTSEFLRSASLRDVRQAVHHNLPRQLFVLLSDELKVCQKFTAAIQPPCPMTVPSKLKPFTDFWKSCLVPNTIFSISNDDLAKAPATDFSVSVGPGCTSLIDEVAAIVPVVAAKPVIPFSHSFVDTHAFYKVVPCAQNSISLIFPNLP